MHEIVDIATLPRYLKKDIEAWEKGVMEKSRLLDCYYCELQASINMAYYENLITMEQADYMRRIYLGLEC